LRHRINNDHEMIVLFENAIYNSVFRFLTDIHLAYIQCITAAKANPGAEECYTDCLLTELGEACNILLFCMSEIMRIGAGSNGNEYIKCLKKYLLNGGNVGIYTFLLFYFWRRARDSKSVFNKLLIFCTKKRWRRLMIKWLPGSRIFSWQHGR